MGGSGHERGTGLTRLGRQLLQGPVRGGTDKLAALER